MVLKSTTEDRLSADMIMVITEMTGIFCMSLVKKNAPEITRNSVLKDWEKKNYTHGNYTKRCAP